MPTLRIKCSASRVEAMWEGDGPRQIEDRPFSFALTAQEAEDIRWYLEDYRIYPVDPQPKIAKRIEQRIGDVGRELFRLVLGGDREAMQDGFGAGQTRYNAAVALNRAGRFADASEWARSALRDYQACENADKEIVMTLKLLEQIESRLRATSPPS